MILMHLTNNKTSKILTRNIIISVILILFYILWIIFVYPTNFIKPSQNTDLTQNNQIILPEITNINIKDKQESSEENIHIEGETKTAMKVTINGQEITVIEGKFNTDYKLDIGNNSIELTITSPDGYFLHKKYTVIRTQSTIQTPSQNQSPSEQFSSLYYQCNSALADAMLSLINNYRVSQGKNNLSRHSSLDIASCNHSIWMSNNKTLSHTGENDSQFYQRCQNAGLNCDAENIANGTSNAQTIFNLWQNSPGHNANMLDEHNMIGIGESGGYWTTVFY